MADGPTNSKFGFSALSSSRSAARPRVQSWRKMYEPLAWTASTICGTERSDRGIVGGCERCVPSSRPGSGHWCEYREHGAMSQPSGGWGYPQISKVTRGLRNAMSNTLHPGRCGRGPWWLESRREGQERCGVRGSPDQPGGV